MPETAIASVPQKLFFLYGTLRRGDDNDITRLMPAPRWVGEGFILGTMYHFGAYPGVVLGGDMSVFGEVYAVCATLEDKLDSIEAEYPALPDEYAKRSVQVLLDGREVTCFVYEVNPQYVAGKPVIASGDWVKDR